MWCLDPDVCGQLHGRPEVADQVGLQGCVENQRWHLPIGVDVSSAFHEDCRGNAIFVLRQADADTAGFLWPVVGEQVGHAPPENAQFSDDLIMNDGGDCLFAAPRWHVGIDFRFGFSSPFYGVALVCCFCAKAMFEQDCSDGGKTGVVIQFAGSMQHLGQSHVKCLPGGLQLSRG